MKQIKSDLTVDGQLQAGSFAGHVDQADTSTSGFGFVIDEDDMVSDSATKIPTQQSAKAFAEATVGQAVKLSSDLAASAANEGKVWYNTTADEWRGCRYNGASYEIVRFTTSAV